MNPKKVKLNHPFFKIVGDGGISAPEIGEGRFIPALIIDIENNIEVAELIKLHKEADSGDTELTWALPSTFFKPKSIFLILDFIRPMKISFGIEFSFEKQYILVDGIISSRGFRVRCRSGQNCSKTIKSSNSMNTTLGCNSQGLHEDIIREMPASGKARGY